MNMQQLSFDDLIKENNQEEECFNRIYKIIAEAKIEASFLKLKKKKLFSTIYVITELMCRVKATDGNIKISFNEKYMGLFTTNQYTNLYKIEFSKSEKGFFQIAINSPSDIINFSKQIIDIYGKILESLAEPFACCSSYVECSDALECLHHDQIEYYGCIYRKNLKNGKIFYGMNKNIK